MEYIESQKIWSYYYKNDTNDGMKKCTFLHMRLWMAKSDDQVVVFNPISLRTTTIIKLE